MIILLNQLLVKVLTAFQGVFDASQSVMVAHIQYKGSYEKTFCLDSFEWMFHEFKNRQQK